MSVLNSTLSVRRWREKKVAFWAGLVFVFLLALIPRSIEPVSRPMQWYDRSVRFWDALLAGDLNGTYQQYHPGVTTMWIAGLGLRTYAATHGWSGNELSHPPLTPEGVRDYPIEAGVAALSLAIAICISLAYVLLARLINWPVAFSGGCLLALDPFYIAQSKVLHVDALLASLMLVSMLFLIGHLQQRKRSYLVLSGVFAGLAFLTKSPSGLLLPYALSALLLFSFSRPWTARNHVPGDPKIPQWCQRLRSTSCTLVAWGVIAGLVFVLLWPAMWRAPLKVLSEVVQAALFRVETPHKANFFAGHVIDNDPGLLYYAATLAWKTTLITLPAICVAIYSLLWQRKRGEDNRPVWWMLIYAGGFFLAMTLAAKKGLRYLLPTFLALDVLAAWGLVQVAKAIGQWGWWRRLVWVPAAIVVSALVVQASTVLKHHPYYGTHHNLLMGGSRVAQHILPMSDQGEGLDLAARFLNSYPGAERMTAGLQQQGFQQFRRNFVGHTQHIAHSDTDFWVFAINSNQREYNIDLWGKTWETCQQTEPLWSISFDGVPYVWIYRAYPHDPEAFAIEHRLDVHLGDHIRLLGYRLNSSDLSAGDPLTVTLFWQSDGRLTEDYHVFVHLLNTEGLLVAQHDGVPVQGEQATWNWRDGEVLQDDHTLVTGVDLPGGAYVLSVGMYDFLTSARLPALSPAGERLLEDCVFLEDIQVTLP